MKDKKTCEVRKKTSIGGQALIEGIMMRGPQKTAMAVRDPKGRIILEECETKGVRRPKICRLPIIRGIFGYIDSMTVGYKCLMKSAELAGLDEVVERPAEGEKKDDGWVRVTGETDAVWCCLWRLQSVFSSCFPPSCTDCSPFGIPEVPG